MIVFKKLCVYAFLIKDQVLEKFKNSTLWYSHTCKKLRQIPYTSLVGYFKYAMVCTIPNLVHVVGTVNIFLSNADKEHWNAVKWFLKYLYGTTLYWVLLWKS